MKTKKVHEAVGRVVELLDKEELRIDEKIAVCRSAAELYNNIMSMETMVTGMQKTMENLFK